LVIRKNFFAFFPGSAYRPQTQGDEQISGKTGARNQNSQSIVRFFAFSGLRRILFQHVRAPTAPAAKAGDDCCTPVRAHRAGRRKRPENCGSHIGFRKFMARFSNNFPFFAFGCKNTNFATRSPAFSRARVESDPAAPLRGGKTCMTMNVFLSRAQSRTCSGYAEAGKPA
jgi:hypothetical protein